MKTIEELREFRRGNPTDEEYMEFLKDITDEEWREISAELGPFPYKGKLAQLRKEARKGM